MAKRYHKWCITEEKEGKRKLFHFRKRRLRIWVEPNDLQEYIKSIGHYVFIQWFDEDCEQGHTYRQILGLEDLDCDCEDKRIVWGKPTRFARLFLGQG